jgi:hypothetical protein
MSMAVTLTQQLSQEDGSLFIDQIETLREILSDLNEFNTD